MSPTTPSLAEYFDSDKFESSASKIWKISHLTGHPHSTSLYFVPESDIAHFNFHFELLRDPTSGAFAVYVTRDRSLIQADLECKRKDTQLMIQLLLIDKEDKQINLKKFLVNLFECDRANYERFQKRIDLETGLVLGSMIAGDLVRLRIGGGILKPGASAIPDAEPPNPSDYIFPRFLTTIPQKITFSSKLWVVSNFSSLKVVETTLPVTAPVLGVSTALHLDLYRHEDTNRLTIGIRRERFFIKDDVVECFKNLKILLAFSWIGEVKEAKWHFQEIAMNFFEAERSNYGNHVKEFIVEEDVLKELELLAEDAVKIQVEAAVVN